MTRSALTLLLIALTPLVAACQDQEARPIVRPVLSVVAHEQTTQTIGPFAGSIEPRYTVALGFQVFGRLVARDVNVGDVVKKGARLAALDPARFSTGSAGRISKPCGRWRRNSPV
jgi:membrane fusion protein, multidrug efflux system